MDIYLSPPIMSNCLKILTLSPPFVSNKYFWIHNDPYLLPYFFFCIKKMLKSKWTESEFSLPNLRKWLLSLLFYMNQRNDPTRQHFLRTEILWCSKENPGTGLKLSVFISLRLWILVSLPVNHPLASVFLSSKLLWGLNKTVISLEWCYYLIF